MGRVQDAIGRKPGVPAPSSRKVSSSMGNAALRAPSARPSSVPPCRRRSSAHETTMSGSSSAARLDTAAPPCPSKTPNIAKLSRGTLSPRRVHSESSMAGLQPRISAEAHESTPHFPLWTALLLSGPLAGPGTTTTAPPLAPSLPLPLPLPASLPALLPTPTSHFSMVLCTRFCPPRLHRPFPRAAPPLMHSLNSPSSASLSEGVSSKSTSSAPTPSPSVYRKNDIRAPSYGSLSLPTSLAFT
mmetsp:Transcript_117834/g.334073  ORF Transcript_117834/g.334073 Transcript_117834/m.334073 type:complete len:243 (+) Transcript_117834:702-1430(+)